MYILSQRKHSKRSSQIYKNRTKIEHHTPRTNSFLFRTVQNCPPLELQFKVLTFLCPPSNALLSHVTFQFPILSSLRNASPPSPSMWIPPLELLCRTDFVIQTLFASQSSDLILSFPHCR